MYYKKQILKDIYFQNQLKFFSFHLGSLKSWALSLRALYYLICFINSLFIHLVISLFCAVEYSLMRPRNRGNECSSLFKDVTLTLYDIFTTLKVNTRAAPVNNTVPTAAKRVPDV